MAQYHMQSSKAFLMPFFIMNHLSDVVSPPTDVLKISTLDPSCIYLSKFLKKVQYLPAFLCSQTVLLITFKIVQKEEPSSQLCRFSSGKVCSKEGIFHAILRFTFETKNRFIHLKLTCMQNFSHQQNAFCNIQRLIQQRFFMSLCMILGAYYTCIYYTFLLPSPNVLPS